MGQVVALSSFCREQRHRGVACHRCVASLMLQIRGVAGGKQSNGPDVGQTVAEERNYLAKLFSIYTLA